MRTIFFILIVSILFSSCDRKEEKKKNNDFSFYLPDADLYITTSKRMGGDFYVMFSKTDSVSVLSENVDYILCRIEDYSLNIVFDPSNKKRIYFDYPYIKKIHKKYLDLIELEPEAFTNRFYHPGVTTTPDTLKNPYKVLFIAPKSYSIIFQKDSSFNSQKKLKKGNMWGE
jgi:hypothetical protein